MEKLKKEFWEIVTVRTCEIKPVCTNLTYLRATELLQTLNTPIGAFINSVYMMRRI